MITSNANRDSFHALNPNSNLNAKPFALWLELGAWNESSLQLDIVVMQ